MVIEQTEERYIRAAAEQLESHAVPLPGRGRKKLL
jgi:hypothetical protein